MHFRMLYLIVFFVFYLISFHLNFSIIQFTKCAFDQRKNSTNIKNWEDFKVRVKIFFHKTWRLPKKISSRRNVLWNFVPPNNLLLMLHVWHYTKWYILFSLRNTKYYYVHCSNSSRKIEKVRRKNKKRNKEDKN